MPYVPFPEQADHGNRRRNIASILTFNR